MEGKDIAMALPAFSLPVDLYPLVARHAADHAWQPKNVLLVNKAWHAAAAARLDEIVEEFVSEHLRGEFIPAKKLAAGLGLRPHELASALTPRCRTTPICIRHLFNARLVLPIVLPRTGSWVDACTRRTNIELGRLSLQDRRRYARKRRAVALTTELERNPKRAAAFHSAGDVEEVFRMVDPMWCTRTGYFDNILTAIPLSCMMSAAARMSEVMRGAYDALERLRTGPPAIRREAMRANPLATMRAVYAKDGMDINALELHQVRVHTCSLVQDHIESIVTEPIKREIIRQARLDDGVERREHLEHLLNSDGLLSISSFEKHVRGMRLRRTMLVQDLYQAALTASKLIETFWLRVSSGFIYRFVCEQGIRVPYEVLVERMRERLATTLTTSHRRRLYSHLNECKCQACGSKIFAYDDKSFCIDCRNIMVQL